jgi:hypothetical protein
MFGDKSISCKHVFRFVQLRAPELKPHLRDMLRESSGHGGNGGSAGGGDLGDLGEGGGGGGGGEGGTRRGGRRGRGEGRLEGGRGRRGGGGDDVPGVPEVGAGAVVGAAGAEGGGGAPAFPQLRRQNTQSCFDQAKSQTNKKMPLAAISMHHEVYVCMVLPLLK